ncbi:transcriptional regulator, IclR family protein (plasmid) [Rhodococcus jostii RHA1]|uniref:Transcriptional regulator, IclR family protein n=1 Tax=Rhodococcus jostii (strain RHA1) TaxID=101510 RepID=Q0RXA8_RHOJR|nr:IclR family transcriptional regulator [Rhodococcus jostii]ABH00078.1 transcriptional regulator, IclR family protein [Rhodococcus jostii RHA1]
MRTTHTDDSPVSVVERVSLVLETFNGAGPLTLAQVTARTGLPRSSVHRLLDQLAQAGWLARSPEQTYELGVKAYEMGQAALNQNRLLKGARPVMHAFAQRTGMTIQLAVLNHGDTVYLAKFNGRASGPTPTAVGQRIPGHLTAVGKVIMAFSDMSQGARPRQLLQDDSDGELVRRTPHSITSRAQLDTEFAQARDRGAAFDRGEAFAGIGCVGVSIGPPDHIYGNLAGLSVCAPVTSLDYRKLVGPARVAAREIWDRCVAADLASH